MLALASACNQGKEEAVESREVPANPPQTEITENRAADLEGFEQPKTLEERRALRQTLATRQATKVEQQEKAPEDQTGSVTGEVPGDILDKIIADLVDKIGANRADIQVLHAESVTWNDGSLGCGKPGEAYTMAEVPGYRVVLVHGGQQYDYRAAKQGFFVLCERPELTPPNVQEDPPAM